MAKISARGKTKLAQANRQWRDSEGWDHKIRLALRSDGKVLRAYDLRSPGARELHGARGWNRGGYSIFRSDFTRQDFTDFADLNGYTIQ